MLFYARIIKLCICIVLISLLLSYQWLREPVQKADFQEFNVDDDYHSDQWQPLGNASLRYKIFSAYFDYRTVVFSKFWTNLS
jgi:hypothetical protein